MAAPTIHRLIPDELAADAGATGRQTLDLHLARYELAAKHARGRVLDCACGVGYGSALLAEAEATTAVVGVDADPAAISYSNAHYARPGIEFVHADATELTDADGFDTIVSLETLEHVRDPEALWRRFVGMLRPGGTLIASVPTTPSTDVNPFHLHDFTARSFRAMGLRHDLREIDQLEQIQRFDVLAVVLRREPRMNDMRSNLVRYYLTHPRAAVARAMSTLRYGFANRYLTIAWQR